MVLLHNKNIQFCLFILSCSLFFGELPYTSAKPLQRLISVIPKVARAEKVASGVKKIVDTRKNGIQDEHQDLKIHGSRTLFSLQSCSIALLSGTLSKLLVIYVNVGWNGLRDNLLKEEFIYDEIESIGCSFGFYRASMLYKNLLSSEKPNLDTVYQYMLTMRIIWIIGTFSYLADSFWITYQMDSVQSSPYKKKTTILGIAAIIAAIVSKIITNISSSHADKNVPLVQPDERTTSSITNAQFRKMGFRLSQNMMFFSGSLFISLIVIIFRSLDIDDQTARYTALSDVLQPIYFILLINSLHNQAIPLIVHLTGKKGGKIEDLLSGVISAQGKLYREMAIFLWSIVLMRLIGPVWSITKSFSLAILAFWETKIIELK